AWARGGSGTRASGGSGTIRMIEASFRSPMHNPHSLTVVIVAKDEERNIAECVASAAFADEVLVLDSNSTDATAAEAKRAGARVVVTDWPGYGPQVARGFGLAHTAW